MIKLRLKGCSRCKGDLLDEGEGYGCIQCGFEPVARDTSTAFTFHPQFLTGRTYKKVIPMSGGEHYQDLVRRY